MAGLARYTQKIFGLDAGSNQMSKYGSFLSTPELYSGATITPDIIQALSNFEGGMYDGVGGAYSPTIQDFNSILRLVTQQLAYIFTRGIPEWDSGTTYNENDFCKVGSVTYYSLIDSNTNNNPASSPSDWRSTEFLAPTQRTYDIAGSYIYTPTGIMKPLYIRVQAWGAGGGGRGSSNDASASDGLDGGDTSFGSDIAYAGKGATSSGPGEGGQTSFTGGPGIFFGQNGGAPFKINFGTGFLGSVTSTGGPGGGSFGGGGGQGGGGSPTFDGGLGSNPGCGGGGAGLGALLSGSPKDFYPGDGGGGGGYFDTIIYPVSNSYPVIIGDGGNGGNSGTGGATGADGRNGKVAITEYYQ